MKLHYYPETDSLYVELLAEAGVETCEIGPSLVADLNASGQVVGLDIDNASSNAPLLLSSRFAAKRQDRDP